MKKILIPFLISGAVYTNVLASEPVFDVENNKLVFNIEEAGVANIVILSQGQSVEELSDTVLPFYARQIPANEVKEFSGVKMPAGASTGTYTVYVNSVEYGDVDYINIESADNYLTQSVVPSHTVQELTDAISNSVGIFNVVDEETTAYVADISALMLGKVKQPYVEFYNDFYRCLACAKLAKGEMADGVLEDYEKYLGIDFDKDYSPMKDKEKDRFKIIIKTADFKNREFTDIFTEAKIVSKASAADHWNVLKKVITDNTSLIKDENNKSLDISVYNNFDKICLKLMDKRDLFYSYGDIIKYIKEASKQLSDSNQNSGGGSGSSGGGGGRNSGGLVLGVSQADADKLNNHEKAVIFDDLETAEWAKEAIEYLYNVGIVNGVGDKKFAPMKNVTRAEFAKMLTLALKLELYQSDFNDVNENQWYSLYAGACSKAGIAQGNDENMFMPDNAISRQDAVVMLKRAMEYKGYTYEPSDKTFSDESSISDYASEAVKLLTKAEIVNGFEDDTFRPLNSLSRAEAAKLIYNMYNRLGG